jgi:GxxExxY protein
MTAIFRVPAQQAEQTRVLALQRPVDRCVRVMRCAQGVHRALGPGLEGLFYARALALELSANGLAYRRDCWFEVRFRGSNLGKLRLDFLVGGVAVEVLAVPRIDESAMWRIRAMAQAASRPTGLVINFGRDRLEARRIHVCAPCSSSPADARAPAATV